VNFLLPLSFTPSSITVILSTVNSLSLNYPVSSRHRTLVLVLSWKLPSHVISLLSYALFTGSGSLNASNTSSSHLPTKFSQLLNLRTFITLSLFNVLAVLALHPSVLLLGHPLHIIFSKNNWSLLSFCFTLSLESTPFISSSTSFWYQFLYFGLTYSLTHNFWFFWFTTLRIHNSLSLSLPA